MRDCIKAKYPKQLKEFKCIGGKCMDTCCSGWNIYIDKITFAQYEDIKNKKITKNIFINDKSRNENIDYGQIKLKNNKNCPFLDRNKYCSIQNKFGEEYLSNICSVFPRIINKVDDYYEISLDVSCIEAAKVILLNKDGIEFEEGKYILGKYYLSVNIDTSEKAINDTNFKYIKEIRDMSIKIIKNRKYELGERLYILKYFLKAIRKELCYNYSNVSRFIDKYNIDNFSGNFERDKTNYMLQLSFDKIMLEKLNAFTEGNSEYFKSVIGKVIIGFKFDEHKTLIDNERLYIEAYDICEKDIFQRYSYIFENYLVNYMFNELFPFTENDVIIDGYIMMLIRFSFIKFCLIGQYLYNKDISKEIIIRTIQIFSKETEHDSVYFKEIIIYLKENELDNERFIDILI